MKIGLLLLATHKYKQFVQPLLHDVGKHFLPGHKIHVYLFTDNTAADYQYASRISLFKKEIPPFGFPQITLLRYEIFTTLKYPECSHLFYLDVDMRICATVGNEILQNLVAVLHPGFACAGGGAWCCDVRSRAYTPPEFRTHYYAGGFQGGSVMHYGQAIQTMAGHIREDVKNNVIAEWHDESHWNSYLSNRQDITVLDSSYCMVEQPELRQAWKIDHLQPRIIALAKNHEEIRN